MDRVVVKLNGFSFGCRRFPQHGDGVSSAEAYHVIMRHHKIAFAFFRIGQYRVIRSDCYILNACLRLIVYNSEINISVILYEEIANAVFAVNGKGKNRVPGNNGVLTCIIRCAVTGGYCFVNIFVTFDHVIAAACRSPENAGSVRKYQFSVRICPGSHIALCRMINRVPTEMPGLPGFIRTKAIIVYYC